jgi:hypothetical protein
MVFSMVRWFSLIELAVIVAAMLVLIIISCCHKLLRGTQIGRLDNFWWSQGSPSTPP